MRDRRRLFKPAMVRGMMAAILCGVWAAAAGAVESVSLLGQQEPYGNDTVRGRDLDPSMAQPSIIVTTPAAVTAGQAATITAAVESSQLVLGVSLYYRTFDNAVFQHLVMWLQPGKSSVTYRAVIPGTDVTRHGIQLYVQVLTGEGTFNEPPEGAQAARYIKATVGGIVTVPMGRRYELIGIPFVPSGSLSQIFQSALGAYDPAQWRLERWDPVPVPGRYRPFPPEPNVVPGHGYYLVLNSARNLAFSGESTSTVGGKSVVLKRGWNMIATPYEFNIPWSLVPRPTGVENQLIGRANDAYVTRTVMEPGQGYFVYLTGTDQAILTIPAYAPPKAAGDDAQESRDGTELFDLPGCDWLINITPTQGERLDLVKTVGVLAPGAGGPGNLHQPPSLPHDLSVWLEREKADGVHQLRRDLRHLDGGAVWDLVVRPGVDDSPVCLAFDGLSNVPASLDVALATPWGTVDLRRAAGQWQQAVTGEVRLRLVVGDPELIEQAAGTLPQPFALLPVYPNPANPLTTVGFTLPHSGRVRIDVYDVAGRRVRTLVDEVRGPGSHDVVWDGADGTGRGLSSGMYLLRLQVDDFSQTRKLTLVR